MLAVAALCWPGSIGRRPSWGVAGVSTLGPGALLAKAGLVSAGDVGSDRVQRLIGRVAVAVGCCAVVPAFVVAGPAGLVAAVLMLGTMTLLVRRELHERRRRAALVDILAALRILGRELQAGADPGLAAASGATVTRGDGALVLAALVQLTRTEDRSSGEGLAGGVGADVTTGSIGAQVVARLHGGWLLTKRHGLAFSPLVAALAQDLSEQLAAGSERAGQIAGPRTSGYVMALLPLLGLALGAGMGADPIRVLLESAAGNVLLVVGTGLTCAGLLWSSRIVRP
jgi:tight adherence protein B